MMTLLKSKIRLAFFALSLCACGAGMQAEELPRQFSSPLLTRKIVLPQSEEVGLEITARSPGASWARGGAEAAALAVTVNGQYQQDLLLWAGDGFYTYRVLLGKLPKGEHAVAVHLNEQRSAKNARRAEVRELRPLLLTTGVGGKGRDGEDDKLAVAHAPFLYARANSIDRFTDLPLMVYYEIEREGENNARDELTIRYTTIFTNEDGGTPTAALMARWGRTTDIEWTYEVRFRRGLIVAETYQGVAHETKPYAGERVAGAHPILAIASDNNNFSDLACSAVRYAPLPVRARLERATRESMMDGLMYRVMVEELTREKRIGQTGSVNSISDPREYLYLEAYGEQRGAAVAFEVNEGGASPVIRSDLGDARLRIERSGYFQTTLRRPAANSVNLVARCYATGEEATQRACQKVRLGRVFVLDQNFAPRALTFAPRSGEQPSLAPGGTITYTLTQ